MGGFPDLVEDGETGFMSPPKAPEALANKIKQAIDCRPEWPSILEKASAKVASVMNVEHNAQEVHSFYEQVLLHYGSKVEK